MSSPPIHTSDADRWLAALAARIEDDPALLSELSDEDVGTLLAAEHIRPSAVATAVRRRVQEVGSRRRRWTLGAWAGAASAVVMIVALTVLPLGSPPPAGPGAEVLAYEGDLAALAGPPTKGAERPVGAAARDLLAAAQASPPDLDRAGQAARALAAVPDSTGAAAFFAGLGYRLARDTVSAERALARVPASSPYHTDAEALR